MVRARWLALFAVVGLAYLPRLDAVCGLFSDDAWYVLLCRPPRLRAHRARAADYRGDPGAGVARDRAGLAVSADALRTPAAPPYGVPSRDVNCKPCKRAEKRRDPDVILSP